MDRSYKGSFTIPEIQKMLNVSRVTAYKISKDPKMKRSHVLGQYRILKKDFWEWYDIATKLHYAESYVYKLHRRAISSVKIKR